MKGPRTMSQTRVTALLLVALLILACDSPPASSTDRARDSIAQAPPAQQPDVQQADSLAERLIARTDSAFDRVELLSAAEQRQLRRYLQDEHMTRARRLGVEPVRDRRAAATLMTQPPDESNVVGLRTNDHYIVDPRMSYAVPLVVPAAAHLLERVGQRFQENLMARGLPPYRFILTNVLRTGIDQAHLRGSNVNVAQGQSTHEYGTTFDIYYGRFHYAAALDSLARRAAPSSGLDEARLRRQLRAAYRRFGDVHAARVKAVLGRTILQLQEEGLLLATYERQQPVFHLTVAREVTAPPAVDIPGISGTMTAAMRRFYVDVESQLSDVDDDIEDLEEQAGDATAEAQQRLHRDLAELRDARDVLWEQLTRLDGLTPSAFQGRRADLQQRLAELEGRLARTRVAAMEREQAVRRYLRGRIRETERTLAQHEVLLENASPDASPGYGQQVANVRSRHEELTGLLQRLRGTSGTDFHSVRSEAADAAAGLAIDLQLISAGVTEPGD